MKSNDKISEARAGFTLFELLVVIGAVGLLILTLVPALARTRNNGGAFQCLNNNRQLANAWRQWATDNNDKLLTCLQADDTMGRPMWMKGYIDNMSSSPANYDPNIDIVKSPLWSYASNASLFKCPADRSTTVLSSAWNGNPAGTRVPRVRSYSMSQVFSTGPWLAGESIDYSKWRTYAKGGEIVKPAKTFLFLDEHPASINDDSFANSCTYNQPNDPPTTALLIDMPANRHNGGCGFSFADSHVEIHKWRSPFLKNIANADGSLIQLNFFISDPLGYLDTHWLAE